MKPEPIVFAAYVLCVFFTHRNIDKQKFGAAAAWALTAIWIIGLIVARQDA